MADVHDEVPPSISPQTGMVTAIGVFNILLGGLLLLCGMG